METALLKTAGRVRKKVGSDQRWEGPHAGYSGLFDLMGSTTCRSNWTSRKSGNILSILHLDRMAT